MDKQIKNNLPLANVKEDPVDLWGFLRYAMKRIWLVLLVTLMCAGTVWGYFNAKYVPSYSSRGRIYLVSKAANEQVETSNVSYTDILMPDYLFITKDEKNMRKAVSKIPEVYRRLLGEKYKDEEVMSEKIAEATRSLSWGALQAATSITNEEESGKDTHLLTITVRSTDDDLAYVAATALVEASLESINELIGVDMHTITIQSEPQHPNSPSTSFPYGYIAFAGILGMAAVLVILFVLFVRDDKIKTSEDVEKHLGLAVLALIPAYDDAVVTQGNKRK